MGTIGFVPVRQDAEDRRAVSRGEIIRVFNLRLTLMWKTLAAAVVVLALAAVVFLPLDSSQDGAGLERLARDDLARIAAEQAPLKAQALQDSQFDRLEARYRLPRHAGRATVSSGLYDINGQNRMAVGQLPSIEQGAGAALFQRALRGQAVNGTIDDMLASLFPLGPSGEMESGEQPLGVFLTAAPKEDVARTTGVRLGIGDWFQIGGGFALAGGLLVALLYWIFLRPIRLIAGAGRELDLEAGQCPLAAEEKLPSDELGEIGRLYNRLVERLREEHALARQANRLVERAEAKYRNLIQGTSDIVFHTDLTGQFLFVSPAIEHVLGATPQELYDSPEPFHERVHPDDAERVRMAFVALAQGEPVQEIEFRMVPDGTGSEPIWFRLTHAPILDARGHVQGIEGVLRNVTAARNLEIELEDCQLRLDALQALSQACRRNLSRRELFDVFARQSAEVLGMERAIVTRIAGDSYRVLGLHGFPEEIVRGLHPLAGAPQGKVARSGRPVALLSEKTWGPYRLDSPYVGVPVLDCHGETIGTICCYGLTRNATEQNVRAVALIAELLAPRLEDAGVSGPPSPAPEQNA